MLLEDIPLMLNTAEAAKALRKSEATVRRMCARGELACSKVGATWLIPKAEVLRLLSPIRLAGGREVSREALRRSSDEQEEPEGDERRAAGGGQPLRMAGARRARIIG